MFYLSLLELYSKSLSHRSPKVSVPKRILLGYAYDNIGNTHQVVIQPNKGKTLTDIK